MTDHDGRFSSVYRSFKRHQVILKKLRERWGLGSSAVRVFGSGPVAREVFRYRQNSPVAQAFDGRYPIVGY